MRSDLHLGELQGVVETFPMIPHYTYGLVQDLLHVEAVQVGIEAAGEPPCAFILLRTRVRADIVVFVPGTELHSYVRSQ